MARGFDLRWSTLSACPRLGASWRKVKRISTASEFLRPQPDAHAFTQMKLQHEPLAIHRFARHLWPNKGSTLADTPFDAVQSRRNSVVSFQTFESAIWISDLSLFWSHKGTLLLIQGYKVRDYAAGMFPAWFDGDYPSRCPAFPATCKMGNDMPPPLFSASAYRPLSNDYSPNAYDTGVYGSDVSHFTQPAPILKALLTLRCNYIGLRQRLASNCQRVWHCIRI
jgi:hypothetical protein